jgi:hypothetical protein
LFCFGP